MKLELVAVPVTDVDWAKDFYVDRVGFTADVDSTVNDDIRCVQLTPPGSACSIAIGQGLAMSTSSRGVPSSTFRSRRQPLGTPTASRLVTRDWRLRSTTWRHERLTDDLPDRNRPASRSAGGTSARSANASLDLHGVLRASPEPRC